MNSDNGNTFAGKILIIGASAAGNSAAKEIRKISARAEVTLISDENHLPYYRPLLTRYIGDRSVENNPAFLLNREEWYRENRVDLVLGEKVTVIDPSSRKVKTNRDREAAFDRLILATGSCPFVPLEGATGCENVFAVRTMDDARSVNNYAENAKKAVIIGGGLLGLEAADALLKRNLEVSIVEMAERILPLQLDHDGSRFLESIVRAKNLTLYLGTVARELIGRPKVGAVGLASGEEIPADMVLFSIGVRPNIKLASEIGLETKKGILVNDRMETKREGIYACGDAAEYGRSLCLWMPAVRQGITAGLNAVGMNAVYDAVEYPATLNSLGTRVFSIGDLARNQDASHYKTLESASAADGVYKKLYFLDDRLVGGILIGDTGKSISLSRGVAAKTPRAQAEELLK